MGYVISFIVGAVIAGLSFWKHGRNDGRGNLDRVTGKLTEARESLEREGKELERLRGILRDERAILDAEKRNLKDEAEIIGRDRKLLEELLRRRRAAGQT